MPNKKKKPIERRKVLKTIGATSIGSTMFVGSVGSASAKADDYEEVKRKSEKAFERSLRKHALQRDGQGGAGDNGGGDVGTDCHDCFGSSTTEVKLGSDTTLDPDHGDKYESDDADSMQDAALMASYDTSSDRLEGRAFDQVGYGTFEAWSYIGKRFHVTGSGSQDATITARPYIHADLSYTGDCWESAEVELVVKDHADDERYDETIFSKSSVIKVYEDTYVDSMVVPLEEGHEYTALVKQTVGTTCSGGGGAHSDITDNNGDTEHIDVGNLDVSF